MNRSVCVNRTHFLIRLFSVLILCSVVSFTQQPPVSQGRPVESTDQEQMISYWTTESGWQSELELRNNLAAGNLTVTLALRLPDGTETTLSPTTVKPQEVKVLDLESAIVSAGARQYIGTYGSAVLRYHSPGARSLLAMVMIRHIGHSIAFHIDGTSEAPDFRAGGREGIWWLPNDSANDYLIIANQGTKPLQANLSLYDSAGKETKQTLDLPPRALKRLSVRQILRATGLAGTYGGIKIFAAAQAGSLDSLHLLFDEQAQFSALLKMFDYNPIADLKERDFARTKVWTLRAPMLALSNPDPALAFPPGTVLRPQLFIRNTMGKPVDISIRLNWRNGGVTGKASGPSLHLAPYETRRVDVAALQTDGILPKDANWASVTLATNGAPDEVVAVAASYNEALRYGAQTPFSDQLSFRWTGSLWEYDAQHDSLITAGNGGTMPLLAAFTVYYNGGTQKYELEQTLQPDEQLWIDMGRLIHEQIPDKNGNVLPPDLASGSYEFRDLTDKGVGNLFEGKVVYDRTFGHVTYGCANCCAYGQTALSFNPLGIGMFSPGSPNGVEAVDDCAGVWENVSSYFWNNWSTGNASVATVDSRGTHTGVNVGTTLSQTYGQLPQLERFTCPLNQRSPSGGDNVASVKILLGGSSGTNITNTTQSVVVGQQIVLYASISLPSGGTATSYSWSIPGTIVAGYSASNSSGSVNTNVTLNQQSATYYWVFAASSQNVTFTLNYQDSTGHSQSANAQATFNIAGATGSLSSTAYSSVTIQNWTGNNNQCASVSPGTYLVYGSGALSSTCSPATPGISFSGNVNSPNQIGGSVVLVQIINSGSVSGSKSCTITPGIDRGYPFPLTNDSPASPLLSSYTSLSRTENFTTYLLWQPPSSVQNGIPIPIGYQQWGFQGSASCSANCGSASSWTASTQSAGTQGGFVTASANQTNYGYPTWNGPGGSNCQ